MLYTPPHFRSDDRDHLLDVIATRPFATLVSNGSEGPVITHLPLMLDRTLGASGTLLGHVARANPHWKAAELDRPSVAIFAGPDAYVSPNWYPSKAETGKAVPTWNYTVIHAEGLLRIHDDPVWLRDIVTRLTDRHEAGRSGAWRVDEAPAAFIEAQLRGIVGISLEITKLVGKDKLSQNRSGEDQAGVRRGLAAEREAGSAAILDLMGGKI